MQIEGKELIIAGGVHKWGHDGLMEGINVN